MLKNRIAKYLTWFVIDWRWVYWNAEIGPMQIFYFNIDSAHVS